MLNYIRLVNTNGAKLLNRGGLPVLFRCYKFAQSSSRSEATTPSLLPDSTVVGARSSTFSRWE